MVQGVLVIATACSQLITWIPGDWQTGPGYAIKTGGGYAHDLHGRPVVLSRSAACSLARLMLASQGAVKGHDIHSSQRTKTWNDSVQGAYDSKHLTGDAIDIHHGSRRWMLSRAGDVAKLYGWRLITYGGHGGHFEFHPP